MSIEAGFVSVSPSAAEYHVPPSMLPDDAPVARALEAMLAREPEMR